MATYTVHVQDGEINDPVEDVIFVRDGFSVKALIFGGLWFLWHRMWLVFGGYIVLVLILGGVVGLGLLHPLGASLLQTLLAFTVGLHATALHRHHIERAGFREVAVVTGESRDDAELRYFSYSA